jgi:hypothetical protein
MRINPISTSILFAIVSCIQMKGETDNNSAAQQPFPSLVRRKLTIAPEPKSERTLAAPSRTDDSITAKMVKTTPINPNPELSTIKEPLTTIPEESITIQDDFPISGAKALIPNGSKQPVYRIDASQPNTHTFREQQQICPSWGLPRVTKKDYQGPTDMFYNYPASAGAGVDVYVLDSVLFCLKLGN